jgi:DNA-binding MarR family transcriptional regulator
MNERDGASGAPGSLAFEVIAALQAVEGRLEAVLEPVGLSLAKFGALSRLVAAGEPLPLGTLAERCACVRSNITQLVDRLEADGLVARVDDPRDRRSIRAELTPEGRRRQAAGLRALEAAEKELLGHLPPAHRGAFRELLAALRRAR